MDCPICGIQLPDKARKCPKCGCRPRYLYGYPRPSKWFWFGIAAAITLILAIGAWLLFLKEQLAPKEWLVPLRTDASVVYLSTGYTYDDAGNLLSAKSSYPDASTAASSTVTFLYENDICTGFELIEGNSPEPSLTGNIHYDEDLSLVSVDLKAKYGSYGNTWTFQYDENGRVSEMQWGDTLANRYTLYYDANGTCTYRDCWEAPQAFVGGGMIYMIEFLYDREDKLTGFDYTHQTGNKSHYTCKLDNMGNVTEIAPPGEQPVHYGDYAVQYTYEYREVTNRTAQQYQLQLYLLEALGVTPESFVIPFVKMPLT